MPAETIFATFTADDTKFQAAASRVISAIGNIEKTGARARDIGLPNLALTPAILRDLENASTRAGELARQTHLAGGAGKNGALGFLAFSQAVEDAQYGVRGILNNIPQMVLGFGGGAGVAGALSLAAVAAVALYPALKKLTGAADAEALKKAADEWDRVFSQAINGANEKNSLYQDEQKLASLGSEFNEILRERFGLLDSMKGYYDGELATQRQAASYAAEAAGQVERQVAAMGGDLRPFIENRQKTEIGSVDKDLANRRAAMELAMSNASTGNQKRDILKAESEESSIRNRTRLDELTRNLAGLEADLAHTEAEKELYKPAGPIEKFTADALSAVGNVGSLGALGLLPKEVRGGLVGMVGESMKKEQSDNALMMKQMQLNAENLKPAIAAVKQEMKELAQTMDVSGPAYKERMKLLDQEIEAMDKKAQKTDQEIKALEALRAQKTLENKKERENFAINQALANLEKLQSQAPELQQAADTARAARNDLTDLGISRSARDGKLSPGGARQRQQIEEDTRAAAEMSKQNGLSQEDNIRSVKEMRDNQEWMERNSGTVKERRERRTAERQSVRDEQRDERVRSAQRERESRDQNGRQKPDDRMDLNEKQSEAADRAKNADGKVDQNAERQTEIQTQIKESLARLTDNIGVL